jgi:hypothetical protein
MLRNKINCLDLPAHMVMVDVIDVFDHFCDLQIDDPPQPKMYHTWSMQGLLHHVTKEGD